MTRKKYNYFLIATLLVLLIFVSLLSIFWGQFNVTLNELLRNLVSPKGEVGALLWDIRIPRLFTSILVGASLSLAGVLLQSTLRNPMASPITLGISHGAMFGAAFAILFLPLKLPFVVTFSAFVGSLLTAVFILFLSYIKRLSAEAIVLSGIAINMLLTSATMFLKYLSNEIQLSEIVYWSFGDVNRGNWDTIILQFLFFVPIFLFVLLKRWDFNAFYLGEEVSKSLGINVEIVRLLGLTLASLLTAFSVSAVGIIPFLGLISPHLARLISGNEHGQLIFTSSLVGAVLLVLSDILSRVVLSPTVVPVSIVTSFLGVPIFLYLLIKLEGRRY
ncbi:FecCD family ABC transporter permease [Balnearium lithotrophicum]|nr:iron ABC transporter permease [Balnearium lithotrophicum]